MHLGANDGTHRHTRRGLWPSVLVAVAVAAGSCAKTDEFAGLPEGALVAGHAAALDRVLGRLERLDLAPLGRSAGELRAKLADCSFFVARAESADLAELLRALECTSADAEPASVRRLRGDADLAIVLPLGEAGRVAGAAHVSPEAGVTFDARLRVPQDGGLAAMLLPDDQPPGPSRLNGEQTLLHGRFRPQGGLDIASLVPEDGQANGLFRLKSELFAGAVLDGNLEFAVYLPEPGRQIPPVALAAGFRLRSAAVAAMDKFIGDLRAAWPIEPLPLALGEFEGTCLGNLRIMPEFAPCYVATEDALVLGWDQWSVERALAPGATAGLDERGGLYVHLDRFSAADRLLRETVAPKSSPHRFEYAWDRLIARTSQEQGEYHLHVELVVGSDS